MQPETTQVGWRGFYPFMLRRKKFCRKLDDQPGHIKSKLDDVCLFIPWDTGVAELRRDTELYEAPVKSKGRCYYADLVGGLAVVRTKNIVMARRILREDGYSVHLIRPATDDDVRYYCAMRGLKELPYEEA